MNYSSAAVVECHDQGNSENKEPMWTDDSRTLEHIRAWQQVAGKNAREGS